MTKIATEKPVITSVAAAGAPVRDARPTPRAPPASRASAYIRRDAPTVEARQQPNALMVVPRVMMSPIHAPT